MKFALLPLAVDPLTRRAARWAPGGGGFVINGGTVRATGRFEGRGASAQVSVARTGRPIVATPRARVRTPHPRPPHA